jgi:hypothetical protein
MNHPASIFMDYEYLALRPDGNDRMRQGKGFVGRRIIGIVAKGYRDRQVCIIGYRGYRAGFACDYNAIPDP